ncbi:MAG: HAMP domain-containing protein [Actinomycetota bacterium]|nr:HAMP domain-containing protein [Actinomycetota bacterium]
MATVTPGVGAADAARPPASGLLRRTPIVARLVAAFILVSLLPITTLAGLAVYESRESGGGEVAESNEEHDESERIAGVPTAALELGVAGASLGLAVVIALVVGRTLVRPVRELEQAIARVEDGDLHARVAVSGTDELGRLAAGFNDMVAGLERETVIRDLFGQYVTPELAAAAIEHRGRLDGQLVTSTVLFADIRDFTGISESLPASELIRMLNRYFDRMARVIVDAGGLVNKFGGDSLLAVFGSPLNPAADHAVRAVRAALAMLDSLDAFNEEQRAMFLPEVMIGVGVASGDVVAGNVGSSTKLEYTVIGDAVNVASRLQALTKELGESALFSAETARLAGDVARFASCGEIDVRGKARPVNVVRLDRETSAAPRS